MRVLVIAVASVGCVLASVGGAVAQTWTGGYVGGSIGAGLRPGNESETVGFDTNLDGVFSDAVRTAAGVDAFSPGFCGGLAVAAAAASGCSRDEGGLDAGGRFGYDWQRAGVVFGGLVDVSRTKIVDAVSAFSTTPAFYAFSRELDTVVGFRGRVGFGINRLLVYGTGGGAWGRVEQAFTTSNAVNTFVPSGDANGDDDGTTGVWGFQAGAGVEVRLGGRWSVTGEYLFTSLDNRDESTIRSQGPAPATNPFILVNGAGTDLQRTGTFDIRVVHVGLSYRF